MLGHHNPNDVYDEATRHRLEGTCDWVFTNPCFKQWESPAPGGIGNKTLWINGPAGFGKTVLCSRLVRYLADNLRTPVAQFFFTADSESREDPLIAARFWLSQITSSHDSALKVVQQRWDAEQTKHARKAVIIKLLDEVLHHVPNCTLIVDGLDECTTRSQVTDFLSIVLGAAAGTSTRLLIVSRDIYEIRNGLTEPFSEINISPDDVKKDVLCYSRSIVDSKLSNKSPEIRTEVTDRMADRCEGQFLWLRIQGEFLKKSFNRKQLQNSIAQAPVGLYRLYERDWAEIQNTGDRDRLRAISLLRWVAFALRPLTVCEIVEAVLLDEADDEFPADELPDCIDQDYINDEVLGLCGSLFQLRDKTSGGAVGLRTVHLAHFTVKQFLLLNLPSVTNIPNVQQLQTSYEAAENLRLARLCLLHVTYSRTWEEQGESEGEEPRVRLQSYTADGWFRHARTAMPEPEPYDTSLQLTMALFDEKHPSWHPWRRWYDFHGLGYSTEQLIEETLPPSPLYYACRLNLSETIASIIRKDPSYISHKSNIGRNALTAAAASGHTRIIETLLEANASVDITNSQNYMPLHGASYHNHLEAAELLIARGADVMAAHMQGWTPLMIVSNHGYLDMAKLLIRSGAKCDSANDYGFTSLYIASKYGYYQMVELLLEHGATIDLADIENWTPLNVASQNGHIGIVQLLLDRGANMTIPSSVGATPLNIASRNGHLEVVRSLLERGADAIPDDHGMTPVNVAASNGHDEVVRLLVERGADITIPSKDGYTPVNIASQLGYKEVVKFLIDNGADISIPGADGWTPLNIASQNGHVEVVKLLLDHGASTAVANKQGVTALHAAAAEGHTEIAKLLIEHGAELNGRTIFGWTPLNTALELGDIDVVKLLLEHGADLTIPSNNGYPPVTIAAQHGHTEVMKLLIKHGSDMTVASKDGWTPLGIASQNGHIEVVKHLIDLGASVAVVSSSGVTPLHAAARDGHHEIVKLLLHQGADTGIHRFDGLTALHSASNSGHAEVIKVLLSQMKGSAANHDEPVDTLGRTPMIFAAMKGLDEIVQLLLAAFPSMHATADWHGTTPLLAAVRNGYITTARILRSAQPDQMHSTDGFGYDACWWASHHDDDAMLKVLNGSVEPPEPPAAVVNNPSQQESLGTTYDDAKLTGATCDACLLKLPENHQYHLCEFCCKGSFLLCLRCWEWGARCLDSSHVLQIHTATVS